MRGVGPLFSRTSYGTELSAFVVGEVKPLSPCSLEGPMLSPLAVTGVNSLSSPGSESAESSSDESY